MQNDGKIPVSRHKIINKFMRKLYHQKNIERACQDDYIMVDPEHISDWLHDMGMILGNAIQEVLMELEEGD